MVELAFLRLVLGLEFDETLARVLQLLSDAVTLVSQALAFPGGMLGSAYQLLDSSPKSVKGAGRALKPALARQGTDLPSTKGVL